MENLKSESSQNASESWPSKAWFWWRVVWAVIRNILFVCVILLTFEKASTAFQTLTLCLLILIYQGVNWSNTTQIRMAVEDTLTMRRLLIPLLKTAGEDMDEAPETLDDIEKKFRRQNPIYYINVGFSSIVYLIVLWKVFWAVLG